VTTIGDAAFAGCTTLTEIIIPNSVIAINGNPFIFTPNLEDIYVEAGNTHFRSEGNSLIRNSDNTLISGTKNSIIPSSVTSIDAIAFAGCTTLMHIIIPNSVTMIGESAFSGCTDLTHITIPNSVTTIGRWAFYGCTSLTIYAEALSQPPGWSHGWHGGWNPDNRPVNWGSTSDEDVAEMHMQSELWANYPNPFNPTTTIQFSLSFGEGRGEGNVRIDVYNLKGQLVKGLVSGVYRSGTHSVVWDGTDDDGRAVSSGVYFYRMVAGEYSKIKRMLLLK
jgi:hypothetical protein